MLSVYVVTSIPNFEPADRFPQILCENYAIRSRPKGRNFPHLLILT